MIAFLRRWWSWIAITFHRAQSHYCSSMPMTVIMEVPADPAADARAVVGFAPGAEADLARMAARAGRARVKVYACGGCRYGSE